MEGILIKNKEGDWMVKWSDLHSYAHGTHWQFTKLSSVSTSIKYLKDNLIMSAPLEEGLKVECELVSDPILVYSAKLIFKEVDEFEKQERIIEYSANGGKFFTIKSIDTIRDGGTVELDTTGDMFYIHKDSKKFHSAYPPSKENLITDSLLIEYLINRIETYIRRCEESIVRDKNLLIKIQNENALKTLNNG